MKVEEDVLGSPFLTALTVSADVKRHCNETVFTSAGAVTHPIRYKRDDRDTNDSQLVFSGFAIARLSVK